MNKAYFTDTRRSIKRTISRFLSIVAIVALGSSFFVGFNAIYPDMIDTADSYYKTNNLMDLRLQSYIGLYEEDLEQIRALPGVDAVSGAKFVDGYVQTPDDKGEYEGIVDIDGSELTVRVAGFDVAKAVAFSETGADDPSYINRLTLLEGRYPENEHECLVTNSSLTTPEQFVIGNKIKVVGDDENINYYLKSEEFEIVGVVRTPYWVSYERGATAAGSGKLGDFVYVSDKTFTEKIGYYSEAYVSLTGADALVAYSEEYDQLVKPMQEKILAASEAIVKNRAALLEVGLAPKVFKAQADIASAEAEMNRKISQAREQVAEYRDLAKDGSQKLADAQAELEQKYAAAQAELQGKSDEYINGVNEYNAKVTAVTEGTKTFVQKSAEYNDGKTRADAAKSKLDEANTDIKIAESEITTTQALIDSTGEALVSLKSTQDQALGDLNLEEMADRLEATNPELAKTLRAAAQLTAAGMIDDAIVESEALMDKYKSELVVAREQLAAAKKEYSTQYAQWASADQKLKAAKAQLDASKTQLDNAKSQLSSYEKKLTEGGTQLQLGSLTAQTQYMTAQAELALKASQLQAIKQTLASAEQTLADKEAEANAELLMAKTEFQKGKTLLENIKNGASWFVYDRDASPGYNGYGQAMKNMQRLSYIFPTFFFIVSTLVCLTTMTRMVEEERTQLGTLKALGYSDRVIRSKYQLYALLASFLGTALGVGVGFYVFPTAINAAWSIMYEMPKLMIQYIPLYIIIGAIFSIGLTVLAAFLACRNELKAVPSVLMRPKPPKAGKRVFLERVSFIWSRLSFTSKVTVRNLFRNKKRFIMTMVGIAGCTALLLMGFGLQDSIGSLIENQYGEKGVAQYDLQVVLKDAQTDYANSEVVKKIQSFPGMESSMLGYLKVCTGSSDKAEEEMEVDVLVPENTQSLPQFVNLINAQGKDPMQLDDNGAIITKKFADKTHTKVGDTVTLSWVEGSRQMNYSVRVTGIAENYTFHYVYMTPACFAAMTGTAPTYNYLFCGITDGMDADARNALETEINALDSVNGTVYTTVVMNNFNNIIHSLNLVTLVIILAAMALAFVVLYNLNNINVNERIRELATLKVLGFYNGEVSAYIYRENVILTLFSTLLGLILGVGLHRLVIGIIDIDTVTFSPHITLTSFLVSFALTVLFAVAVNMLMHFKLKKISMVDSLKSVE